MPEDKYGEYELDTGLDDPVEGRCNAPLKNWKVRYGEKRFCGHTPEGYPPPNAPNLNEEEVGEMEFCSRHNYRKHWNMRAKELLQHGAYSKNTEFLMDNLPPWDKLLAYGLHESLMGESVFEYSPEFKSTTLDFSDEAKQPPMVDEDGIIEIEFAYPTEKTDRGYILFCAAIDTVKMINVNTKILEDEMEVETTEHAQLTSPTETNPDQQWREIEGFAEHHLNLAYSRLSKDRKDLLAYGGVQTGTEVDMEENSAVIEDFAMVEMDDPAESPHIEEGSGLVEEM